MQQATRRFFIGGLLAGAVAPALAGEASALSPLDAVKERLRAGRLHQLATYDMASHRELMDATQALRDLGLSAAEVKETLREAFKAARQDFTRWQASSQAA